MMLTTQFDANELARQAFYARYDKAVETLSPDLRPFVSLSGFNEEKDGSWELRDSWGKVLAKHRSAQSLDTEAAANDAAQKKQAQYRRGSISVFDLEPRAFGKVVSAIAIEVMQQYIQPMAQAIVDLDSEKRIDAEVIAELAKCLERVDALEAGTTIRQKSLSEGDGVGAPGSIAPAVRGIQEAIIDREGQLVLTMTDGTIQKLGRVIGQDGLSVESRELEYVPETHEIVERWTANGKTREFRYPAGGIRDGGYWRQGVEARKHEVMTHAGSTWLALRDTKAKPCHENPEDWRLFARKGRDAKENT
jgi:hypothetical protein